MDARPSAALPTVKAKTSKPAGKLTLSTLKQTKIVRAPAVHTAVMTGVSVEMGMVWMPIISFDADC